MLRTEIYVNNILIDLLTDIPMSFTYSIADIREPEKRNAAFSKTITIPGSNENNILLGNIFRIDLDINSTGTTNFTPSFNPNLKADVIVYVDKVRVFKGAMQIIKINITDDYQITYEVILLGSIANIFLNMGSSELTDLDLSEFDHIYNKTDQRDSWIDPVGIGYVYPMIDYGYNDLVNWKVEELFPAIYLKQYIDKIFDFCGFSYTSDFFDSDFFKRLIIPLNSDLFKLTDVDILPRLFEATVGVEQTISEALLPFSTDFKVVLNGTEVSDVSNQYNPATGVFTCLYPGHYSFEATQNVQVIYNTTGNYPAFGLWIDIVKNAGLTTTQTIGSKLVSQVTGIHNATTSGTTMSTSAMASQVYLNTGDTVKVFTKRFSGTNSQGSYGFAPGNTFKMTELIKTGGVFKNRVDNLNYAEGDTVVLNSSIPEKIKMKDLFLSVVKAFNLYVDDSGDITNHLNISPRNDFYTSGTTRDWTSKLDISSEMTIEPMGALDANRYIFTYDEDSDYLNAGYKSRYNRLYGDRQIDIINDFVKGNKENKLIFAPTPSAGVSFTERVLPTIITKDSNGSIQHKASKIRMLYWSGLKESNTNWNYISTSGTNVESVYPYCGHLDDPYNSSLDLNFGVPSEIFWASDSIFFTNNNLYNKYHKQFIEEITNKNSKIVTAKFILNTSDISSLDFRDKIIVDGNEYRINKVIDYNPLIEGTTTVELLKIVRNSTFAPVQGDVMGGEGTELGADESNPLIFVPAQYGGNIL